MASPIKTITLEFNKWYILYLDIYLKSQNAATNTSTLYGVISMGAKSGGYISASKKSWKILINGSAAGSGTFDPDLSKNSQATYNKVEKATGTTVIVKHTSDGSKTINVSATVEFGSIILGGSSVGTKTVSGSIELPRLERNSTISSATNVAVNGTNASTVTINPSVASYSHKVTWSIGTHSHSETLAAGVKTISYEIPNSWKDAFPDAKSGECKVKLETLSGTTRIGSIVTQTITLSCIGNETPEFDASVQDANGIKSKIGCFVVDRSKLKVVLSNVEYKFGAKLSNVSVSMEGTTYTGTSLSVTASGNIKSSGTRTINITLTDSRGYSKSISKTVEAFVYNNPSVYVSVARYRKDNGGNYQKDDGGEWGKVYYRASYSEIGNNSVKVDVDYSSQIGTDTGAFSMTDKTGTTYVHCNPELVYNFTITVADALQSTTFRKQLSSDKTIFDILYGGIGLAIGGVATVGRLLDVFWDMRIKGSLKVDKPIFRNYFDPIGNPVKVSSGTEWTEICEVPELEDGAYHFDIVARFPANSTGNRGLAMEYSDDGGATKHEVLTGWTDVRSGLNGYSTFCRITANTTVVGRKLYIKVLQTSGGDLDVSVRISCHRIN